MGFQLDKVILDTKTSLFLLFKSRDVIYWRNFWENFRL